MSAFAVHLDRLLVQLRDLPSSSPPRLAHLTIRLERAYADLRAVGTPAPAELFIRIRSRLQELGEGLREARSAGVEAGGAVSWEQLDADTREVERDLVGLLERSAGTASTGGGHSRTPSADLPRRIPAPPQLPTSTPVHPPSHAAAPPRTSNATDPPATSPVRPVSPSIFNPAFLSYHLCIEASALIPEERSMGGMLREILFAPSDAPDALDRLRGRVAEQFKRAYFEPFEATLSSDTSTAAEKAKAWDGLWHDVKDAALPLAEMYLEVKEGEDSAKRFRQEAEAPLALAGQDGFDASAALARLESIVGVLKRYSVPRGEMVSAILDNIISAKSSSNPSRNLVDLVRQLLELVNKLEEDLRASHNRLMQNKSFLSDADIERVAQEQMRSKAHAEERRVISEVFGGTAGVVAVTRVWLSQEVGPDGPLGESTVLPKDLVANSLVEMLFKDQAVDFHNEQNCPPPIFFIPLFALVYLQNQFQALIVLACLATLVGSTPAPSCTSSISAPDNLTPFVERLWTILQSEIGPTALRRTPMAGDPSSNAPPSATRIANLADEVISHRRTMLVASGATLSSEEEARLRAGVERILRYEDPVYKLLKGRLKASVEAALVDFATQVPGGEAGAAGSSSAPSGLRTGRSSQNPPAPFAALRDVLSKLSPGPPPRTLQLQPAKGFERPAFLREKVEEVVRTRLIANVWEWMEESWSDVLS
ncbi:hypothetical protein RTG_02721 [Rhodotorula toruloides ATCC 204091]|uniref:FGENESH: predicted gene_1.738 protein n=1 Tax=Rhodotorula toruloides TaxID=5286 RepID=A0A0K3C8E4_RHOTO|nr:hypothetical protein RTG_02721 [Rhodotorula toruloides ATCC 204091]KAK4335554.1 hypothetical protein RTBOTA2_004304 [Rhodotorula toruloides]PRQ78126.1 hypothetical protein AAT19DRAFT_9194 [Rhodotorula toruloides]